MFEGMPPPLVQLAGSTRARSIDGALEGAILLAGVMYDVGHRKQALVPCLRKEEDRPIESARTGFIRCGNID